MSKKTVVITCGDPAGCGPLITLKAIEKYQKAKIDFFVVGDEKVLVKLPRYKRIKKRINLIDLNTPKIDKIKPGYSCQLSGRVSLNYLDRALGLIRDKKLKCLVTAPVSKEAVRLGCKNFSGHTEYLAGHFKVSNFAMMLASPKLKVILLTRHVSLKRACSSLQKRLILNSLLLTHKSLQSQFKIKEPKIALASINPHAGINTFIENEEKMMLEAIAEFGKKIYGPYPADTLFIAENIKKYDCIVCAYHDQAMIPFKLLALHNGVNITLGLPIIRTSPAHGVAFDIMKSGRQPFFSSMVEAIKLALKLSPLSK